MTAQRLTEEPAQQQPAGCADVWKRWKPWLLKNYLVLGFAFVLTFALSWPLPGKVVRLFLLLSPSPSISTSAPFSFHPQKLATATDTPVSRAHEGVCGKGVSKKEKSRRCLFFFFFSLSFSLSPDTVQTARRPTRRLGPA